MSMKEIYLSAHFRECLFVKYRLQPFVKEGSNLTVYYLAIFLILIEDVNLFVSMLRSEICVCMFFLRSDSEIWFSRTRLIYFLCFTFYNTGF